ncbi:iron-containing alcohol dehydrogenase [Nocardia rhamnosiphila]
MSIHTFSRAPLRVRWGAEHLGAELDRCGAARPVLVCTPSVARDDDLLGLLTRSAGRDLAGVISDIRPHSPADAVAAAADRLSAADAVVVVGGGSAMVTARAANILRAEGTGLSALATRRNRAGELVSPRPTRPKLPMVVLPTTPTTAATKAGAAVTEPDSPGRLALFDPGTRARCVIVDPALTAGAPAHVVRDAAINALVMALEGVTTRRRNIFADAALGYAAQQLPGRIRALADSPDDPDIRVELVLLALMVGDGTDSTGGGLTAALSHTIGHRIHAHNGVVDAIVLPHVLELVARRDPACLSSIAEVLGCPATAVATTSEALLAGLSMPRRLGEIGVTARDLASLARAAMDDFAASGTTFRADEADLERVLENAL